MYYEIKKSIREKDVKKLIRCIKSSFPSKWMSNLVFYKHHHRWINYELPLLFDEKLLILRDGVYKNNSLVTMCTDKVAVRNYVESEFGSYILNELYGVYDCVEEIEWESLPQKFVIKCNHGCGYNIVVKEKDTTNMEEIYKQLNEWMKEDYSVISSELHYHDIQPKILVEKFIETETGELPIDYKFFASRGKIICVLVYSGRGVKVERVYVDETFNDLEFIDEYTGTDYESLKPESFDEMLLIAKKLSENFPFVRVDLYNEMGKVIFGELTFTPHGCCHDYLDEEAQLWIGERVVI